MTEDQFIDELIDAGATEEEIAEALVEFRKNRRSAPPVIPPPAQDDGSDGVLAEVGSAVLDEAKNIMHGVNVGVSQIVTSPLRLEGALEQTLGVRNPVQFLAEETGLVEPGAPWALRAGQAVDEFVRDVSPQTGNEFAYQVAQGAGQVAGIVATGGLSAAAPQLAAKAAPAGLLQTVGQQVGKLASNAIKPVGIVTGSMVAAPEWEAAKAKGLSDEEAFSVLLKNYLVGQTEALPIEAVISRLNRITGGKIMEKVKTMGIGALSEFVQEGVQTYLTNEIARAEYDPDRDPLFQVLESASVGGVVGMLIPAVGFAMGQAKQPDVKKKLLTKLVDMAAKAEIAASANTADPAINTGIDNQVNEVNNAIQQQANLSNAEKEEKVTEEEKPLTEREKELAASKYYRDFTAEDHAITAEMYRKKIADDPQNEEVKVWNELMLLHRKLFHLRQPSPAPTEQKPLPTSKEEIVAASDQALAKGQSVLDKLTKAVQTGEDVAAGKPQPKPKTVPTTTTTTTPTAEDRAAAEIADPERERLIEKVNRGEGLTLEESRYLEEGDRTTRARNLAQEFDSMGVLLGAAEETKEGKKLATAEQVADFLRNKGVKTRKEVVEFQQAWNELQPRRPLYDSEVAEVWERVKPAPKDPAAPTITAPINQLLKEQIQTFYRGVEKGVRRGQKMVNELLIPKVTEALKGSKLTRRQTHTILTQLKRTNLFTPGSFDKLNRFIDAVVGDADYAEALGNARRLQKRVRKFGRRKSGVPVDYKTVAQNFARLDPSQMTRKRLDEYIEQASSVIAGFMPVDSGKYAEINTQSVEDYIDKVLEIQETEQDRALSEKEDKTEELREIAQGSLDALQDADLSNLDEREKEIVNTIRKLNVNELDSTQLKRIVKVIDNIVENDDLSDTAFVQNVTFVQDFFKKFNALLKSKKISPEELNMWDRNMENLSQMISSIYKDDGVEAFFRANVHQALLAAGSEVETALVKASQRFDKELNRLNKKYKTDLRDINNKADMMVFSLLYQMEDDTDMAKMHRNIKETIARHEKATNDIEAEAWKKAYTPFEKVSTPAQAKAIIMKKNPAVYEMWQMFGNDETSNRGLFTDEIANEQQKVAKEVYNRQYAKGIHFTPIVQHHVNSLFNTAQNIQDKAPGRSRTALDPKQARTAMRRTLNLMPNGVYTLEPYTDWILRYGETLYDNKASRTEAMMAEMIRHEDFTRLLGGKENAIAVAEAFERAAAIQRGTNRLIEDNEAETLFTELLKTFRNIGTIKALASYDQWLKQSTVMVKLMANLTGDGHTHLLPAAMRLSASVSEDNPNHPAKKLIDQSTLIARGLRMGGTDRGTSEVYKLQRGGRKTFYKMLAGGRVWLDKRTRKTLEKLIRPDVFNARTAFFAYYLSALKRQGVTDIDMNTEFQRQNEPERKLAMAHAEAMVEKTQTPSNPAAMSQANTQTQSKGWEVVKHILLPFSTFDLDFKARFMNELGAVRKNADKRNVTRFAGTVGEALAFASLNAFVLYWYKEGLKNVIAWFTGVERPEKGEATRDKEQWQQFWTQFGGSINPIAIGVVGQEIQSSIVNEIGYQIAKDDNPSLRKKDWLKDHAIMYQSREGTTLENLGVYSTGAQPLIEIAKTLPQFKSVVGEPVTVIDAYGNERQVLLTEEQQKLLFLKVFAESLTLAGVTEATVANAIRAVYREQMREAKRAPAVIKEEKKTFKRPTPKTFKTQ